MGKSTINGSCSIAMLNYQRVPHCRFPRENVWQTMRFLEIPIFSDKKNRILICVWVAFQDLGPAKCWSCLAKQVIRIRGTQFYKWFPDIFFPRSFVCWLNQHSLVFWTPILFIIFMVLSWVAVIASSLSLRCELWIYSVSLFFGLSSCPLQHTSHNLLVLSREWENGMIVHSYRSFPHSLLSTTELGPP